MEEERAKKEPNRPKMAQDGAKMIQHGAKMEPRWPRVAQDEAKMAQYGGDMIQDGGGSRIALVGDNPIKEGGVAQALAEEGTDTLGVPTLATARTLMALVGDDTPLGYDPVKEGGVAQALAEEGTDTLGVPTLATARTLALGGGGCGADLLPRDCSGSSGSSCQGDDPSEPAMPKEKEKTWLPRWIAIIELASNRMAIAKVGSRIPQLPAKHRQEANETHTLKSLRSRRWSRPAPQQMLARALASSSRCVSGDQAKKLYIKTPDQPLLAAPYY